MWLFMESIHPLLTSQSLLYDAIVIYPIRYYYPMELWSGLIGIAQVFVLLVKRLLKQGLEFTSRDTHPRLTLYFWYMHSLKCLLLFPPIEIRGSPKQGSGL